MALEAKFKLPFDLSFARNNAYPLDADAVWDTLVDAEDYAKTASRAYVGQTIAVSADSDAKKNGLYIILEKSEGTATLKKVGGADVVEAENYKAAKELSKTLQVGQLIDVKSEQKIGEGDPDGVPAGTYKAGFYIVNAPGTISSLSTSTGADNEVEALKGRVDAVEKELPTIKSSVETNTSNISKEAQAREKAFQDLKGETEGHKIDADYDTIFEIEQRIKEAKDSAKTANDGLVDKLSSITPSDTISVNTDIATAPKVSVKYDNSGNVKFSESTSGLKADIAVDTGAAEGQIKIGDSNINVNGWSTLAKSDTVKDDIAKAKKEVLGGGPDEVVTDTVKSVKDALDDLTNGTVATNTSDISALKTKVGEKNVSEQITDALSGLTPGSVSGTGKFVTAVDQTNGKITVTKGDAAASDVSVASTKVTGETKTVETAIEQLFAADTTVASNSKVTVKKDGSGLKYTIYQGGESADKKVFDIDIPKDMVVTSGEVVKGTWGPDGFTEGDGTGTALKLVIANQEKPVYINTLDLVKDHTPGNGISISDTNEISIKKDGSSEAFLAVDGQGIRVTGIQTAINTAKAAAKTTISEVSGDSRILIKATDPAAEDGHINYEITANDIAKASDLATETSARTEAENVINQSIKNIQDSIGSTGTIGKDLAQAKSDISALQTKVDGTGTLTEQLAAQKTAIEGTPEDTKASATIAGAKKYADEAAKAVDDKLTTLNGEVVKSVEIKGGATVTPVGGKATIDLDAYAKTANVVTKEDGKSLVLDTEITKLSKYTDDTVINKIDSVIVNEQKGSFKEGTKDLSIKVTAQNTEVGEVIPIDEGAKEPDQKQHESTAKVSTVLKDIYDKLKAVQGAKVSSVTNALGDKTITISGDKDVKLGVNISGAKGNIIVKDKNDGGIFAAIYYDGDDVEKVQ